jgi:protein disulfide-isomerase A1
MKSLCIFVLILAVAFAETSDFTRDEGVVVLTTKNFEQALADFDYALVEFYAPWCGHCKHLAPEYAKAAQTLAESNPEIKLCKVDATEEGPLAEKYEVGGYPTIKFFTKGKAEPVDYNGGRTAPEIIAWLKKKTGPPSVEVNSVEEIEKHIRDNDAVAVFFGDSSSSVFSHYTSVASDVDEVVFISTTSAEAREKYGAQENHVVIFVGNGDERKALTEEFDVDKLREFVENHRFPTVMPFNQGTAQRIFGENLDAIFLIKRSNDAGNEALRAFKSAALETSSKLVFSYANIEDDFGGRLAEFIGVTEDQTPALRIVQVSKNLRKFIFDKEVTTENVRNFIDEFVADKLQPFFKSEEVPAESHENHVRVIVGKNFNEVVLDSTKDVLIELYAPWCGHCKQLAPIYEAVAERLKDSSNLIIAKMDATTNEVENLEIEGFPTLKFYPANNKNSPIDYDDDRSQNAFVNWIKKHATTEIVDSNPNHVDESHDHHHHDHDGHDHGDHGDHGHAHDDDEGHNSGHGHHVDQDL